MNKNSENIRESIKASPHLPLRLKCLFGHVII